MNALCVRTALSLAVLILATLSGHFPASTLTGAAQSQAIDPVLLNAYRWRSIGPDRGGRSIAVGGVKGRPREAYFGAVGGGLWKTTDAGNNWAPVTDGQINSSSVGAVAVSESNPDIVYIGMGETCIRGNIMPGDGVYKSADAGKTWAHVGFRDVRRDLEDPHPPDQPRHRLRGRVRQVLRAERGARRLQEHRRRQDLEAHAVQGSAHRRRRHRDRRQQPQRDLRRAVGGVPHRIPDVERRTRQRPVQVDRRRRDVDRDHPQSRHAVGRGRPHRRGRHQGGFEPRLRAGRERERRAVRVRRCRRDVEDDQHVTHHSAARVLLHARLRRPQQQGRRLHAEHVAVPVDRRRQDHGAGRPEHARRPSRPVDGSGRSEARGRRQRRRRRDHLQHQRPRAELERAGLPDRAVVPRDHHDTPALPRVRLAAGQQHAVRAEQHQRGGGGGFGGDPPVAPYQAGGGEPGYIAPHATDPGHLLRRHQQRLVPDALNRRTGELKEVEPIRASSPASRRKTSRSAGSGPTRSSFRTSIRTCSTRARSACGRPPTAATAGRRSAATSRGTIRRRCRTPAGRSPTT